MSSSAGGSSNEATIIDRLVRAADATLKDNDVDAVTIDAVAAAAGVSRATAFRRLGGRDNMVVAVALKRATAYGRSCVEEMDRQSGTFAKLGAAFRYLAREIPADQVIRELLTIRTAADLDTDVHDVATATLGPVLQHGRALGEIRTDVPLDDIITWTVEQVYLAMQQHDRSEAAVNHRVTSFLVPALAPRDCTDALQSRIDVAIAALDEARRALSVLSGGPPSSTYEADSTAPSESRHGGKST